MLIEKGDKLHVITRRLFEGDLRRHLACEVVAVEGAVVRAKGYVFVLDAGTGKFVRHKELRERIIGLADSGHIVNVLPRAVDLARLEYMTASGNRLVITDGDAFSMDINEFGGKR